MKVFDLLLLHYKSKTKSQRICKKNVRKGRGGTRRPEPSKVNDITAMVKELQFAEIFDYIPGREFSKFPGFSEVFSRVKVTDLHKWLTDNKERLSYETL